MKFGLLCDDPAAAWLISCLRQHAGHSVSLAVLVSPAVDQLLFGLTGVKCTDRWEDLLAAEDLDAVIVGGDAPEIWDAARQLAANSVPLVVFPTIAQGPAILYELSLIRDDRQSVLFPVWRHRFDPALRQLKCALGSAEGPISFVQWEQSIPLGSGTVIRRAMIEDQLLSAADQIRFLFGSADQVTALRTGGTEEGALIQSVILAGRLLPESTWTLKSADEASSRLLVQTPAGPWKLERSETDSPWRIADSPDAVSPATIDSAEMLAEIVAAVEGRSIGADWSSVLHAAEILDAANRSLERRRTIDLNHEPLSERLIFKTQMAAMGCSILLITLGVLLGFLMIDSLAPLNRSILKVLLVIAAVPLFGFLLFQFLLPLTRTSNAALKSENAELS